MTKSLEEKLYAALALIELKKTEFGTGACPECEWDNKYDKDDPHDDCDLQDALNEAEKKYPNVERIWKPVAQSSEEE